MVGVLHIIGAGLSGLACAVEALKLGQRKIVLYEATAHAGGRCRSFLDPHLDRVIDNGTHLILSANTELLSYAHSVGASAALHEIGPATFPFIDLRSGQKWTLKPGLRLLAGGVPGMRPGDLMDALRVLNAPKGRTVAACVNTAAPLYERLLRPFCVSVLNAQPEEAEASLLGAVLGRTIFKGERASRAVIAPHGLGAALIEPAIAHLKSHSVTINVRSQLVAIQDHTLNFKGISVEMDRQDHVVLAVPWHAAGELIPGLRVPTLSRAIFNLHLLLDRAPALSPPYLGFIGGHSQWLSIRGDVASVTISDPNQELEADRIWEEVRGSLGMAGAPLPPHRLIVEKRATFAQTPEQAARRPGPRTVNPQVFLAGDWTDTGLPCTLEGAALSGRRAAQLIAK